MSIQKVLLTGFLLILLLSCTNQNNGQTLEESQAYFDSLRSDMVQRQIVARGVNEKRVIDAMLKVPRHVFVPPGVENLAYKDEALPIGWDQTISQPYIVAFMTDELNVSPGDRVLEIGTGSGYQSAVLAQIADSVYSIEIIPELAKKAAATEKKLGYNNIVIKQGDGYLGWPEKAPFDAIIVTAAPPTIPPPLLEQLKVGGRMILPVGEYVQELVIVNKNEGGMSMDSVLPVRFVPMTGKIQEQKKDQ